MRPTISANFFTPEAIADPYAMYDELRPKGPVLWNELMQAWNAFGFDEVSNVLVDDGTRFNQRAGDPELIYWFDAPNMQTVDGDEHKRLRKPLLQWFTRGSVAKWETRVREVVDELLAPLAAGRADYDLISEFTMIPTIIVADMLGLAPERYHDVRRWSHDIISSLAWGHEAEDAVALMKRTSVEINDFVAEEVARRRREPSDDILSALIELEGDDTMSDAEIRSTAVLLLLSAYDTTAKTMGNTLVAFEQHPEQRREVANDPSLIHAGIEEALRWGGLAQFITPRLAVRDVSLGGAEIAEGETVIVFPAAANRDPSRWPDPERFDIHREAKSHVAFGWGPHLCIGAQLARLEARIAFAYLMQIAPEYQLRDLDLGNCFFMRGPERGYIDGAQPAAV